jgi:serine/threonine protein phosphatase 1
MEPFAQKGLSWLNRLFVKAPPPRAPAGVRLYAVGDIHGRLDLLDRLLEKIRDDGAASGKHCVLVFLGDYVDRGADAYGVIERLLTPSLPGWDLHFLRGNHDQAVLDFLEDAAFYRVWRAYGAAETLLSYGVSPPRFDRDEIYEELRADFAAKLPAAHRAFFAGLEYCHCAGDYYFVHAGIRPGIPLERQMPVDQLWIRDDFLHSEQRYEKVVVHGHTPVDEPVSRINRIGVDTGAYATGILSAVVLDDENRRFLSVDDVKTLAGMWRRPGNPET